MTTLADWKHAFEALDRCPWAGPRPLRNSEPDRRRFVGRESDTQRFTDEVLQHQLVVLTGESGVGKSSLLNARLRDALQLAGFQTFVCSDWTWPSDQAPDVDVLIRSKIEKQWDSKQEQRVGGSLCDQLDSVFGGPVVLILDQFEELIRYQPALFDDIVAWILSANHRNSTHIVLSLRIEYRHRLRPIEREARPFSMSTYVLEPLTDKDTVRKIISSAEAGTENAITPAAADLLLKHWLLAGTGSHVGWNDVSLFQLQGTLYALHAEAQETATPGMAGRNPIGEDHVTQFTKRANAETRTSYEADRTVFHFGIREAVSLKLARCRDACRHDNLPQPLDSTLVDGTNAIAHRLIPHLSSGGYKLARDEWELARLTLSREIEHLTKSGDTSDDRPTGLQIERVFRNLSSRSRSTSRTEGDAQGTPDIGDLLSVPRSEVARTSALEWSVPSTSALLKANGVDLAPWEVDRNDVSSGPLLGMPAKVVMIEELRRLVFALHWLETAELIRASSPSPGQTMLSLIHDGFATALEHWAGSDRSGPENALCLLSAARGETYYWRRLREPDRPLNEFDGSNREVTYTNLRWRDCQVSASFKELVFVNCDFRGTRFRECRFQGVVFVNCLLDGAAFDECTISGTVGHPPPLSGAPSGTESSENPLLVDTLRLPAFRIEVSADAISDLRWYRELPDTQNEDHRFLYSRTSGLAAVPWQRAYGMGLEWRRQTGGLTMYGGRLSSLMIRRSTFYDGGTLALRYIAGSALDIVEHKGGGRIDIAMSAIRGFTVSRSLDDPRDGNDGQELDIHVLDSFMTNVWFGDGLRGKVAFESCKLWHVCNVSDRKTFDVAVLDSPYYALVNVSTPDARSKQMPFDFSSDPDVRETFARDVMTMDYRSIPARLELTRPE